MLNATSMLQQLWYGRTNHETVDRGFEDLQSIMYCGSNSKSGLTSSIKTKTDTQFKATKHLLTTASWLESAAKVLEAYTKILCNNQTSRYVISKRSHLVKRYIIPLLWHAANSMKDISTTLAPTASVSFAHKRTETKRKIDVVDEGNTRMSPDLQLVCNYLSQEERRKRGDMHEIMPPKKKLRISSHTPGGISYGDKDDIDLPLPLNDHEYRKPEVVNILASYKKGSKEIGLAMKK
jgi:hypothetical protein